MVVGGVRKWQGRLWAVATAAAAPMVAFAVAVSIIHVEDRRNDRAQEYAHVARALASAVDAQLGAELEALRLLASAPTLQQRDLASFHRRAQAVIRTHSNWATIGVMEKDGGRMLLSTTKPYPGATPPPIDPDSIRAAATGGKPVIGALIPEGHYVKQPLVLLRIPVMRGQDIEYVLSASVRTAAIADIVARQRVSADVHITVLDASGAMVATIGPPAGQSAQPAVETAPVSDWRVKVAGPPPLADHEIQATLMTVLGGGLLAVLASTLGTLVLGRAFGNRIKTFEQHRWADLGAALGEARRAQSAANAADAAKSRFLAAASHDLRQPFQAMHLYYQVLDALIPGPPKAREALRGLHNAVEAGDELLGALMDLSAIEAGTVKPQISTFQAMEVVEEVSAEYREIAAQRNLHFHVCRLATMVESDRVLLKRIVRNLIHNAFRYTQDGGVLVGCRRRGDRLLIQVWDTGPGIPADKLEMIFEDFYQVGNQSRDRRLGLGLGLSVVKRMAGLLCHELTVESRVGKGSVFTIAVPVVGDA